MRTPDAWYVFWWVYFFVVGAVAKLLGGVMMVSRSNTNPISIEPPRNFLYDSNIEYTCSIPVRWYVWYEQCMNKEQGMIELDRTVIE